MPERYEYIDFKLVDNKEEKVKRLSGLWKYADSLDIAGKYKEADQVDSLLEKIAKPSDMTKAEKKYWKEAEKEAKKSYDPNSKDEEEQSKFYGTATKIYKAKVKDHLGYDPFKKKKKKK